MNLWIFVIIFEGISCSIVWKYWQSLLKSRAYLEPELFQQIGHSSKLAKSFEFLKGLEAAPAAVVAPPLFAKCEKIGTLFWVCAKLHRLPKLQIIFVNVYRFCQVAVNSLNPYFETTISKIVVSVREQSVDKIQMFCNFWDLLLNFTFCISDPMSNKGGPLDTVLSLISFSER